MLSAHVSVLVVKKQVEELTAIQTELGEIKQAEAVSAMTKARMEAEYAALLKEKQSIEEGVLFECSCLGLTMKLSPSAVRV